MSDRQLTPNQSRAVTTIGVPLVVTAAAGSGKTTVLVSRFVELLKRGVPPRSILTVTFTNEAAAQLKTRIARALNADETDPTDISKAVAHSPFIGTLHSFCYWVLNQFGSVIKLRPVERILTPFEFAADFDAHWRSWSEELSTEELRGLIKKYKPSELKQLLRELYQKRHRLTPPTGEGDGSQLLTTLFALTKNFRESLENHFFSQGLYQFDDLEVLAYRILSESPDTKARLRKQFRYALIDEFQDTSESQWRIIELLFGEDLDKLFVVGDPKQSIYGFRDAEVKLFFNVSRLAQERGGEEVMLAHNFRSTAYLVDQINRISERLFDQGEIPFYPMEAGAPSSDASDTSCEEVRYESDKGTRADASVCEIKAVVSRVKEMLEHGTPPEAITLLFRVSDRIPNFAQALRAAGIPARAHRTKSLLGTYESADLIAFLRALNNPVDNLALASFLATPHAGFEPAALRALSETQREKQLGSLFETLLFECPDSLRWFLSLVESGNLNLLNAIGLLAENSLDFPEDTPSLYGLMEPFSEPGLSIPEAIRKVDSWQDEMLLLPEESAPHLPGVQLMTVHNAKGLEFPHVFLVDMLRQKPKRDKLILIKEGHPIGVKYRTREGWVESPAYTALAQKLDFKEREEARRVLYVALTRAIQTLSIFLPQDVSLIPKESWGGFFLK